MLYGCIKHATEIKTALCNPEASNQSLKKSEKIGYQSGTVYEEYYAGSHQRGQKTRKL